MTGAGLPCPRGKAEFPEAVAAAAGDVAEIEGGGAGRRRPAVFASVPENGEVGVHVVEHTVGKPVPIRSPAAGALGDADAALIQEGAGALLAMNSSLVIGIEHHRLLDRAARARAMETAYWGRPWMKLVVRPGDR